MSIYEKLALGEIFDKPKKVRNIRHKDRYPVITQEELEIEKQKFFARGKKIIKLPSLYVKGIENKVSSQLFERVFHTKRQFQQTIQQIMERA